ncbi:HPP family protein [Roseisolibacter sp. H3M3-2]|uniref:HPP family protein n=1 Tax=Roseisolibacter sp. H3M3-2 TaxID=3031323 RepID=UPI0023DBAD18|nr:HPP family protein [Roseisolibacter sp. H3M3-2]MDF1501346.1 HPP family protein [Roseisolibacter sp. H3M3-2]
MAAHASVGDRAGPTAVDAPRRESLEPSSAGLRRQRRRLPLRNELALAALPTATVLGVLSLVEALTMQRLLFASLASSAFLIYLDPEHGTNRVKALVLSQSLAAGLGWLTFVTLGAGYAGAALALVGTILGMVLLDVVHPPAVATAMSFALRAEEASNLVLFALALAVTVVLIGLQRVAVWSLLRLRARPERPHVPPHANDTGRRSGADGRRGRA